MKFSLEYWQNIRYNQDYDYLLDSTIVIGESTVQAHRVVLAQSTYFNSMFKLTGNTAEIPAQYHHAIRVVIDQLYGEDYNTDIDDWEWYMEIIECKHFLDLPLKPEIKRLQKSYIPDDKFPEIIKRFIELDLKSHPRIAKHLRRLLPEEYNKCTIKELTSCIGEIAEEVISTIYPFVEQYDANTTYKGDDTETLVTYSTDEDVVVYKHRTKYEPLIEIYNGYRSIESLAEQITIIDLYTGEKAGFSSLNHRIIGNILLNVEESKRTYQFKLMAFDLDKMCQIDMVYFPQYTPENSARFEILSIGDEIKFNVVAYNLAGIGEITVTGFLYKNGSLEEKYW